MRLYFTCRTIVLFALLCLFTVGAAQNSINIRAKVFLEGSLEAAAPPEPISIQRLSPTAGMSVSLLKDGGMLASTQVRVVIDAVNVNEPITMQVDVDDKQVVSTTPSSPITIAPNGEVRRTAVFELEAVGEGNAMVTIVVTDDSSNSAEVTIRVAVVAISAPPAPVINSPADGTSFSLVKDGGVLASTQVSVVIAAGDENGDITMELQLDEGGEGVVSISTSSITIASSSEEQRTAGFELKAVGEGNTTVTIVITDNLGNEAELKIRVQVRAIPAPEISSPADGTSFSLVKDGGVLASTQVLVVIAAGDENGDITMELQLDEGGEGVVSISTSSITIASSSEEQRTAGFELRAIGEGNTTVTIVITDNLGNEAELKIRVQVRVIPAPEISSPADGTSFSLVKDGGVLASTQVSVVIAAGDENGDITMEIQLDEGGEGVVSISTSSITIASSSEEQRTAGFELRAIGEGNTTVTIVVTDNLGNEAELKIRVQVRVIPAPEISSPADGTSFSLVKDGGVLASTQVSVVIAAGDENGDITMELQLDEGGEGVVSISTSSITIASSSEAQRTAGFELRAIGEGNTTVTIVVTDNLGNEAELKIRVQVRAIPAPEIIKPTAGMPFNLLFSDEVSESTQVSVVIKAGDANGDITMTLQVDDGGVASISDSSITIVPNGEMQRMAEFMLTAVSAGNTTVTIVITDNFGSTDTVTIRVQVDIGFRDCPTCPVMVVVPAGEFVMGSTATEVGRAPDEGPQHGVSILADFAVGKYEVTRGQYAEFAASTSTISPAWQSSDFSSPPTDNHPVEKVNWNEAKAYIAWLSDKTGQEYRLLSEAEWEYVARAGTTTPYSFGNTTPTSSQARYWHEGCTSASCFGTDAVGSYPANAFGLHDVHGNVWEWVEDCWHGDYEGAPTDGSAWTGHCEGGDLRVLRGGSWFTPFPPNLRSANRLNTTPINYADNIGFRIARTLSP